MRAMSVRLSGGLFLLLQAALLQMFGMFDTELRQTFTISAALSGLAALAFLAAIGFFLLQHTGWLLAMAVQGLCLFLALMLYFDQGSPAVYLSMLYSIFMVLYLNSFFVQVAFRTQPTDRNGGEK